MAANATGTTSFKGPGGSATTTSPAPGIFRTNVEGHLDVTMARHVVEAGDRVAAAAGFLVAFHDWEAVTGYETQARVVLTEWGVRLGKRVERVHLLVKSRIVAMGVAIAGLVLRGMLVSYTDRKAFEAALADRIAQARRPEAGGTPPDGRR